MIELVKTHFDRSLELHGLHNSFGAILDAHLVLLVDGENDRIHFIVFSQDPQEELGQIKRVNELSQWFSRAPNCQLGVVFCVEIKTISSVCLS